MTHSKVRLTHSNGHITIVSWFNYQDLQRQIHRAENTAGLPKVIKVEYLD